MATLINNAGVQHYANKMVLAENRKVGSKSLPTALADIDNLIDEMKTHFDTEYGSALDMKLDNNENVFSVGTGTNVDKRSEVENSFTDVELSGNSLVNLCPVRTISHTKIDDVQLYSFKEFHCPLVKVNTTYTVFVNITKNPNSVSGMTLFTFIHNGGLASEEKCFTNQTGYQAFTLTTKNMEVPKGIKFRFANSHGGDLGTYECTDLVILEGDWTNKPLPQYFKGLKSVGEKEDGNHKISITSRNKNLWDLDNVRKQDGTIPPYIKNGNEIIYTNTGEYGIYVPIKVKTGQTLKIRGIVNNVQNIRIFKESDKFQGMGAYNRDYNGRETEVSPKYSYTFKEDGIYHIRVWCKNTGQAKLINFLAEISDSNTTYEPHKSDKKEISLNEPLRGLPNGVKDTIEKINGEWKIVRRCGETIFDGSENWGVYDFGIKDTTRAFSFIDSTNPRSKQVWSNNQFNSIITNNLKVVGSILYSNDCVGVAQGYSDTASSNQWLISIPISSMNTNDSIGFKDWLSANNVKIIYELITPIIEDISPVTLQCWKNGTISIDEVLPVETTHTVALNKPAQIKRNIEELTALRKRVQALEDFYDQIALEQAHQLSLINHSIELDYNI